MTGELYICVHCGVLGGYDRAWPRAGGVLTGIVSSRPGVCPAAHPGFVNTPKPLRPLSGWSWPMRSAVIDALAVGDLRVTS